MAEKKPDMSEGKAIEDKIREKIDEWNEKERAIAFMQLRALGMDSEKAHRIKLRLGLTE